MKMEMAIKSGSQREGGVVVFIGKRGGGGQSLSFFQAFSQGDTRALYNAASHSRHNLGRQKIRHHHAFTEHSMKSHNLDHPNPKDHHCFLPGLTTAAPL